ncbi:hypothetical protein [Corallococcus terminator]|uniref:Type 4 fimbrial biogenesis protein PilX N-terminal domain-containing protein n=1 Tax=Corallococcus terminator TaxID=2316733 RepID=A0A3A8J3J5_9BACT|nr:hypothetical protein [Corallococcus terminator]RKG90242.1 hypothetical protein D7V88_11420 [Corallococcus terminator]
MVQRTRTHSRQPRGFTLLLALGVVAVVTMAVMLSFSVVGREADTQSDTRRKKEAFYAAEAGMAEGREKVRLLMTNLGPATLDLTLALGAPVNEPGLGNPATDPWFEVLPGPGGAGTWNYYGLDTLTAQPGDLQSGPDSLPLPDEDYADYPVQNRVRYRVFLRNDRELTGGIGAGPTVDYNRQVWLIAVGEVEGIENSRPTRSVVQALVSQQTKESKYSPGSTEQGGGDGLYNYGAETGSSSGGEIVISNDAQTI